MPDDFLVFAATAVLREHVDLGDRFPCSDRDILYMAQCSVAVEQIRWIEKADARQFLDNAVLSAPCRLSHLVPALIQVGFDMRQLHKPMGVRVHLPLVLAREARCFPRFTTILIGVRQQRIAETALLFRHAELVSVGSALAT